MDLRADARLPFSPKVVFGAYRDEMPQLLPYLPNVRRIDVMSRTEDGPTVHIVNEWHGGGEIPAAVRAVLGDAVLSWSDHATWNEELLRCDWRTETRTFAEALRCAGQNLFLEDGPGRTLLQVRGTLEVDAKKIRGVPSFVAGKVGRVVEEFLGGKIQLNLVETGKGLTQYLEQRSASDARGQSRI
jgi:hypothetical protein